MSWRIKWKTKWKLLYIHGYNGTQGNGLEGKQLRAQCSPSSADSVGAVCMTSKVLGALSQADTGSQPS